MKTISSFSGLLIFVSFILSLYAYFLIPSVLIYSSIFAWAAMGLLFTTLRNKMLLYVLLFLTLFCLLIAFLNHFSLDFHKMFSINLYLLSLLIGVGFLRLITSPKNQSFKKLPQGQVSFFKTYWGIHLFGSVINLSSLLLVADKMVQFAPLSRLQIIVLTRAFSSDAYWSPFFVAFAAAVTYAPQLNTFTVLSFGLILAMCAFILTFLELRNTQELNSFDGYPLHFDTLYIPFFLAFLVLVTHYFFAETKIIVLIALFSLLLCVTVLPFKSNESLNLFVTHITQELPQMKNELALFLIAGAFGVTLSSILMGLQLELAFEKFDGTSASVLLFVLIVLSFIGIHPIISIAIIGNWMSQLNHTLLAVTFLMSWATAVSTSPFSGLNLTMQSRYGLKAIALFKLNIFYAIKMYLVCACFLFILAKFLDV